VWQDLGEELLHPESIRAALERAPGGAWLPQELPARKQASRKALDRVENHLDRLTDAYLHAILSLAEYQRRPREVEQQKQALATPAQRLDAQVDRRAEVSGLMPSLEEFCPRVREGCATATFAQKRTLVELVIAQVLGTNGEVEIRPVFPTHPQSEKTRFCHLRKDYFQ
jgi:site-specific DNA recombinase